MNIKLQKRNHTSLRRLTKVDADNNVILGQDELYVRIEDVPSNLVNSDATPLSESILENINWRDEKALLFQQAAVLPEPIEGVSQIVSLENGELWCVPGSAPAFKINTADLGLYLKKNFQSYEAITLLGSITKIGALPADFTLNRDAGSSSYIEMQDGSIGIKIKGIQKHVFNTEKVSFTHQNGEICINDTEVALKNHTDKTTIGLINGSFYIKGNNTQISEDLTNNKLNFYTNLDNAVYGNQAIYLEFYPSLVRFKAAGGNELLAIKTDGSIYANSTNRVIDSSTVNNYIKNYFDTNFEKKFKEYFEKYYYAKKTIITGATQHAYLDISENPSLFHLEFSDTQTGTVMTAYFHGLAIDTLEKVYRAETQSYYLISQYHGTDDSEDSYIRVIKYDSEGNSYGTVWIRGLYQY